MMVWVFYSWALDEGNRALEYRCEWSAVACFCQWRKFKKLLSTYFYQAIVTKTNKPLKSEFTNFEQKLWAFLDSNISNSSDVFTNLIDEFFSCCAVEKGITIKICRFGIRVGWNYLMIYVTLTFLFCRQDRANRTVALETTKYFHLYLSGECSAGQAN